jgi:putative addiction module killer protein
MKYYTIATTEEYDEWYDEQSSKSKLQVDSRLLKIQDEGHFGVTKDLEEDLYELKWKNGRRIYYAYLEEENILLLLGGNKNGQNKDINHARNILSKKTEA